MTNISPASNGPAPYPALPELKVALWSIRNFMDDEPNETLNFLRDIGVRTVEVAGFYLWSPTKFASELKKRELQTCSIHGPIVRRDRPVQAYVDWATSRLQRFGARKLCLEMMPKELYSDDIEKTAAIYDDMARTIVNIANALAAEGIRLDYHCYEHDFLHYQSKYLLERLFALKPPATFGLQLDTYWFATAKVPPEDVSNWPVKVNSIHLNKRNTRGECCVIDGSDFGTCEAYMLPLMRRCDEIDWFLENDPDNDAHPEMGSNSKNLVEQCLDGWPKVWATLLQTENKTVAGK